MKNKYRKLGDYIQPVDIRNSDLQVSHLLGLSIEKCFIESIANTIGTDFRPYKIVKKGQFAYGPVTSRNGDKITIALLKEVDVCIISSSYSVFEIIDTSKLLPDYLMLWFSRPEFDRYARYKSHGSVREIFDWDEMCRVELPIPDIKKQQKIVDAYNSITKRIKIKQNINENLEKTAQTLFEKSCNNENTEITLGEIAKFIDGDRGSNYPTLSDFYDDEYCLFLNASNVTEKGFNFDKCQFITEEKDKSLRKGHLSYNDIVLTSRGTVGNVALYTEMIQYKNVRINSGMLIIRPNENKISVFVLYALLRSIFMKKEIERFRSGSAQPQLPVRDLEKMIFRIPNKENCSMLNQQFKIIYESITTNFNEIAKLQELEQLVISRISGIQGEG